MESISLVYSMSGSAGRFLGSRRLHSGVRILVNKLSQLVNFRLSPQAKLDSSVHALLTDHAEKLSDCEDDMSTATSSRVIINPSVDISAFLTAAQSTRSPVAWFRCSCSRSTHELSAAPSGRSLLEYMSLPPSQYINIGGVERVDSSTFRAALPPISFAPGLSVQPVCILAVERPTVEQESCLGAGCDISTLSAEVRGSPAVEALNGAFVCAFAMRIRHLPAADDDSRHSAGRIGGECDLSVGVQGAQ